MLCGNGNCIAMHILFIPLYRSFLPFICKISSVAFAKGDPKNLVPSWSDDIDYTPVQGWFTNAVAQAKEDKGKSNLPLQINTRISL